MLLPIELFTVLLTNKLDVVRRNTVIFVLLASLITFAQQRDSLTIPYNYVNSVPQNADIYLNGTYIGKTPMHFKWEKDDLKRSITLKLEGYAEFNYTPPNGEELINKTFMLIPLAGMREKEIVFKDKSYAFPKPFKIVPIIISSAVTAASAILAYYFKSLAIDKNDEFEQTGDPSLIDKKKKYDLIGGISIAVFQIGFGALIYYHFIDH